MRRLQVIYEFLRTKNAVEWTVVATLFAIISATYMGGSFANFNSIVLGKAGDHTAGIMFVNFTHPLRPWPGFSSLTNYPYGENFRIPISATTQGQLLTHWLFSKATSIVTGWNLMVFLGYMCNALIMYAFVRWLTSNKYVAFFAGLAVTFNPYHAFASTGQIAGMFSGIFVLALWRFILLWKKPSPTNALILGVLFGVSFYTDGYFILISLAMIAGLWISILSYYLLLAKVSFQKIKPQLYCFLQSNIVALLCLLPLVWINLTFANEIGELLGGARSNIALEAHTYSARLIDYAKPSSVLYLGISIIGLMIFYFWNLRKSIRNTRKLYLAKNDIRLFFPWTVVITTLIALWLSLQPTYNIGNLTLYNPSFIIISVTSVWRVFGRLYIVVAIGSVILASLGLLKITEKYPRYRAVIIAIVSILLMTELAIPSLRYRQPSFNYNEAPRIYTWLANDPSARNIRAIAEYPLEGYGFETKYFTYIQISKKPIINANIKNNQHADLKLSIIGINDPQTLPVLRSLGVDIVNIRDISKKRAGRELKIRNAARSNHALKLFMYSDQPDEQLDSYAILPGELADYALGFDSASSIRSNLVSNGTAEYVFQKDATMKLIPLTKSAPTGKARVIFDIYSKTKRSVSIIQDGKVLWNGDINDVRQTISASAKVDQPIHIYSETVANDSNSVIVTNLRAMRI